MNGLLVIVALLIVGIVAAIRFWPKAKATKPVPATFPLGLFDPMRRETKAFNIDKAVAAGAEVTEHATPWSNTRVITQPLARNTHIDVGVYNGRMTRFDRDEILFSIECK